jgi:single-stranded DNA-binding protein
MNTNKIQLSLRAATDPKVHNQEEDEPTFVSVFALHNLTKKNGDSTEHTIPVTAKFFKSLAARAAQEIKIGYAFAVEGRLSYYKNPTTEKESYSIIVDEFDNVQMPRSTKPQLEPTEEVCHV